ncbi:MAG: hypothetical protein C4583_12700 [Anaerolineaceae bacterium]|nr:MAG: hypothetical protein C4583_12700 [Anaerolineaceae bacterium]
MASKFNCPNCGGVNEYAGEGDTVPCQFCGSDVHPPEEMVNQARVARVSSKAKVWIILFIVVVFVLPTCIGLWGTLVGIAASVIGIILGVLAPLFGG